MFVKYVFVIKMPKQGDFLWYCFMITLLTLRIKNPNIEMSHIISKIKTWFTRHSYQMKAIYFVEDYEYGTPLTPEGMYGMQSVLQVLKMFYDKRELLDPPHKDADVIFLS